MLGRRRTPPNHPRRPVRGPRHGWPEGGGGGWEMDISDPPWAQANFPPPKLIIWCKHLDCKGSPLEVLKRPYNRSGTPLRGVVGSRCWRHGRGRCINPHFQEHIRGFLFNGHFAIPSADTGDTGEIPQKGVIALLWAFASNRPRLMDNDSQKEEGVKRPRLASKRDEFLRGRTVRCAKSRLLSTTGSHGPQGTEVCTLQPLLVHQGFFFLI